MKTTSSERFITRRVVRQANLVLISGSKRFDKSAISESARAAMPTSEKITEAGRNALQRMRERESNAVA